MNHGLEGWDLRQGSFGFGLSNTNISSSSSALRKENFLTLSSFFPRYSPSERVSLDEVVFE